MLACAALVALCYANTLHVPFVLDDPLPDERLDFRTRPLVWATFALNRCWSGGAPWSYHLLNAAAHLACGLVLLGVLRRAAALVAPALAARTRAGLALATTALWLCHPLQTSAVTYVSQRAETLASLFYLGTLYGFLRALGAPRPWRWQLVALLALALGFATKEIVATAPALLLLAECALVPGPVRANLRRRWRFHALAVGLALVLFAVFVAPPLFAESTSSGFGFRAGATPLEYLRSQPGVVLHYLRLVVWPHPLVFDYGWPVAHAPREWLPQALALLALLALALVRLARRSWTGFALAGFFLVLLPTSSIVPIRDLAFEHRMVLPLALPLVLLVAGIWRVLPRAGPALAVVATLALAAATIHRNREFAGALELWSTVVARAPDNPRGHRNLAAALIDLERYDEAERALARAEELDPHPNFVALVNRAAIAAARGRIAPAIEALRQALALDQTTRARLDLARLLLLDARPAEAEAELAAVLAEHPHHAEALELLARARRAR